MSYLNGIDEILVSSSGHVHCKAYKPASFTFKKNGKKSNTNLNK